MNIAKFTEHDAIFCTKYLMTINFKESILLSPVVLLWCQISSFTRIVSNRES
jgi:hypothetical protein